MFAIQKGEGLAADRFARKARLESRSNCFDNHFVRQQVAGIHESSVNRAANLDEAIQRGHRRLSRVEFNLPITCFVFAGWVQK